MRLEPENIPLNNLQMKDWFYSFGSSYEELFNEDAEEIDEYEKLLSICRMSQD